VLVKVLRVGVDGTDKEIAAAEYGAAPPGLDYLIIGHEGFGRVEAIGPNVTGIKPGDYVVATVRRPGNSRFPTASIIEALTNEQKGFSTSRGPSTSSRTRHCPRRRLTDSCPRSDCSATGVDAASSKY